ncbi:hypothetical protein [Azospirillum brasilense]|uniref:hypothetical protein n=1 Tax=Azospirillum brasilense TaxID=192 RepID=UPI0013B42692|nr:hypothetical protein [Azospirillum brasilense]
MQNQAPWMQRWGFWTKFSLAFAVSVAGMAGADDILAAVFKMTDISAKLWVAGATIAGFFLLVHDAISHYNRVFRATLDGMETSMLAIDDLHRKMSAVIDTIPLHQKSIQACLTARDMLVKDEFSQEIRKLFDYHSKKHAFGEKPILHDLDVEIVVKPILNGDALSSAALPVLTQHIAFHWRGFHIIEKYSLSINDVMRRKRISEVLPVIFVTTPEAIQTITARDLDREYEFFYPLPGKLFDSLKANGYDEGTCNDFVGFDFFNDVSRRPGTSPLAVTVSFHTGDRKNQEPSKVLQISYRDIHQGKQEYQDNLPLFGKEDSRSGIQFFERHLPEFTADGTELRELQGAIFQVLTPDITDKDDISLSTVPQLTRLKIIRKYCFIMPVAARWKEAGPNAMIFQHDFYEYPFERISILKSVKFEIRAHDDDAPIAILPRISSIGRDRVKAETAGHATTIKAAPAHGEPVPTFFPGDSLCFNWVAAKTGRGRGKDGRSQAPAAHTTAGTAPRRRVSRKP